ncbi:hypothetical protein H5410_046819 [Solanum commersonii]|uniref:Uncharacterized protein n=1 Tax=Solanum commersonii TaxID=4109 RepID=A0A9J5XDA5_SOLCO|nr:hypothetical protein H5410_046819 [Solanum commersonii]
MTLPNDNMTTEMLAAQAHIWNHTFIYINSMPLKCAIELGIPDIINSNGRAMTLSDLVNALPINNNAKTLNYVFRLMCILVHGGFFNQIKANDKEEEGYLLTRLHALFGYDEKDPKLNRQFNEAMASDSQLVISVVIENYKGVFDGLKSLVEVGGGIGIVSKVIVDAFLEMNCIVFYLPHVIEECEGSKNLNYVGGNMLKFIPSADAILLKWVLYDWNDEECIKILKKFQARRREGR